ncbi:acyltransferase family protein [Rugamonas aquatica]|uniref:Acyltransferase family protein n=1 Tax=Rugamonas aquatica TaxID=2743357 RepID=A0A6A7NCB2_9BURK|nr:acyltransferase family protein [Rugamonas aquatica]MQA42658.1 acyltransferase family protein [Rugamonas aquatica]
MSVISTAPPAPASLPYRPDIDGLRALAVLAVVFYHAFPDKLRGGFVGVDVFFVISGYLISHIIYHGLQQGAFSFASFYSHRVRRIFPALVLVLAACYGLGAAALLDDEFAQLARHTAASAGFVQNLVLYRESGYFDNASELKPLMHLWSLAVEEQFYLLFPVLVWAVWRRGWNLAAVVGGLALLSFGLNVAGVDDHPARTFFLPQTRLWELLAGALLAQAQRRAGWAPAPRRAALGGNLCALAGLALLLGSAVGLSKAQAFPGWWALLPVLGGVLLIMAGPQAWINRHLLGSRPLRWIGKISYPLYLWHWPLLAFARILDELPIGERNAAVILSFVLAWLTWRLVEQPLRYGGHGARKTVLLGVALACLAGLGLHPIELGRTGVQTAQLRNSLNRFDYPYKQSCRPMLGAGFDGGWCNAGNAGALPPDTLLIGDSFSNAYAPMLAEHVRDEGERRFVQIGMGGCPVLADYGRPDCRAFSQAVAGYLQRTPSLRTVILAGHWPAYVDRQELGPQVETAASFDQAFARSVAQYQARGLQVVVLLAPPTGSKPRSCIARPITLTHKRLCDVPTEIATDNDGGYRSRMLPLLAQHRVAVFDPFPVLCPGKVCKTLDGEHILYADINHLSLFGAQYLARNGKPALDAALPRHGKSPQGA